MSSLENDCSWDFGSSFLVKSSRPLNLDLVEINIEGDAGITLSLQNTHKWNQVLKKVIKSLTQIWMEYWNFN